MTVQVIGVPVSCQCVGDKINYNGSSYAVCTPFRIQIGREQTVSPLGSYAIGPEVATLGLAPLVVALFRYGLSFVVRLA